MVDGTRPPVLEYASRPRRFRSNVWKLLLKDASVILIVSVIIAFVVMLTVVLALSFMAN
jgi:hypothetical protein